MNIVIISTLSRRALLNQTCISLYYNCTGRHHFTLVLDDPDGPVDQFLEDDITDHVTTIITNERVGASAARNIGASSIPKYRRHRRLMFCDDDCCFVKEWDTQIEMAMNHYNNAIISGHAHPFNHPAGHYNLVDAANVLSTVNMAMPWELWDDVGFFTEPGGAGGSEDVDYCARATKKGYGLAVTRPQCCIHTGLTSSTGRPIVGADLVRENNRKLEEIWDIQGKVTYQ